MTFVHYTNKNSEKLVPLQNILNFIQNIKLHYDTILYTIIVRNENLF